MTPQRITADPRDDEFYVGYLPVPPGHRRFLIALLPMLLVGVVVGGVLVAAQQQSPGAGQWEFGVYREVEGVVLADPYPMLLTPPIRPGARPNVYLLVKEGKHGARDTVAAFDGEAVRVRGSRLDCDGRAMLELASAEDAIVAAPSLNDAVAAALRDEPLTPLSQLTLRGEIIDPKCYLGAMKPGGGKTHKECATLCIRGGIPPMFVTRDRDLRETFYLLTGPDGRPILEEIVPFIGDAVQLSGRLARRGDLLLLMIDPGSIQRL